VVVGIIVDVVEAAGVDVEGVDVWLGAFPLD
jgi:hypothetical protein